MAIAEDRLTQVGPRIHYLDSRRMSSTHVSGVYLVIGDGVTLIETATTRIAPLILWAAAEISFVLDEAERQLEVYHRFVLTRLERGIETRRIAEEAAELLLEGDRNANPPRGEDQRVFLRSMLTSIVAGYQEYFRRSGRLG